MNIFGLIDKINGVLWSYIVITMLVVCAFYFTWGLRGVQFTKLGEMFRNLFHNGQDTNMPSTHRKHISSFQAFAVSLSSRVGTGNLAGVASAIFVGGPGAIFWMWVMAMLGASTAFMEATLAQLFKRHGKTSFYGGPAFYMQYGLGKRWMGILFAISIICGFGLSNQLVQSNTLCDAIADTFSVNVHIVAIVLMFLTLFIIFGGIHRIARFSSIVVPIMALGYLLIAIYVLAVHITEIPGIVMLIVKSAFGWEQAAGGTVGMAITMGVRRGLFSNEAGEGSAPNAAATASVSHPVKQGLLQSLGVYTDTLLVCSCTAFIILLSGLYNGTDDGIILTSRAMDYHLGSMGRWFLTLAITLFAYSTIIGNYFYGESNVRFISSKTWPLVVFRLASGAVVLAGGYITLQEAWTIVDLLMAIMTILNLIAVVLLGRYAFRLLEDYLEQRRQGKDPVFDPDMFPEADIEAWRTKQ